MNKQYKAGYKQEITRNYVINLTTWGNLKFRHANVTFLSYGGQLQYHAQVTPFS